jgi:hypothetical protein
MASEAGRRDGEGFLARWSRLKRGEEAPPATPVATPTPATPTPGPPGPEPRPGSHAVAAPATPAPEEAGEPPIDLDSLPKIEELTAESDIAPFLQKGVPAALRNAALRRAWTLDPTIRDFIGPADYAWDWNVPGGAPGYVADLASGPDVEALADRILGLVRDRPGQSGEAPDRTGGEEGAPAVAAAPPADPVRQGGAALPDAAGQLAEDDQAAASKPAPDGPTPDRLASEGFVQAALPAVAVRPRHGGAVPT